MPQTGHVAATPPRMYQVRAVLAIGDFAAASPRRSYPTVAGGTVSDGAWQWSGLQTNRHVGCRLALDFGVFRRIVRRACTLAARGVTDAATVRGFQPSIDLGTGRAINDRG